MKQKNKQCFKQTKTAVLTAIIMLLVTACSKNSFEFTNAREAVNACHKELSNIRYAKGNDIKTVAEMANRWSQLQDTVLAVIMRDSTVEADSQLAKDFFLVADSIRKEIMAKTLSKKRTMTEIVTLKILTAKNKDEIQSSQDYKNAVAFYQSLDKNHTFTDIKTTMLEYRKILKNTKPFKKEGDVLRFIKEEDVCFRSLMKHLTYATDKDLMDISVGTNQFFETLFEATKNNPDNPINKRMKLFISMRYNRRILQNAEAIQNILASDVNISTSQAGVYRWMLLQPYLTIDNTAMATMTEQQIEQITSLSENLTASLQQLDSKINDNKNNEQQENMQDAVMDFLLKSYMRQIL